MSRYYLLTAKEKTDEAKSDTVILGRADSETWFVEMGVQAFHYCTGIHQLPAPKDAHDLLRFSMRLARHYSCVTLRQLDQPTAQKILDKKSEMISKGLEDPEKEILRFVDALNDEFKRGIGLPDIGDMLR